MESSDQKVMSRLFPQLYDAAKALANDYKRTIERLARESKNEENTCLLEVEASFGHMKTNFETGNPTFDPNLSKDAYQFIETRLNSCKNWSKEKPLYLVYDFISKDGIRARHVFAENNQTSQLTLIQKSTLFRNTLTYQTVADEKSALLRRSPDVMQNKLVRVNMKLEEKLRSDDKKLFEFNLVRISMRRAYFMSSSNFPDISWKFELISVWEAKTAVEAEKMMHDDQEPIRMFELEVVGLPKTDKLSEDQVVLLFISLLIKMQDFLEYSKLDSQCLSMTGDSAISKFSVLKKMF